MHAPDFVIATDRTPVPVRGEALHPILWRGRQWAVTTFGIEALDGTYAISADRLAENVDRDWGWPAHLAAKNWTDREDFCTAWLVAIALHGARIKPALVRNAIDRVYRVYR
jgi:hypothetical protein